MKKAILGAIIISIMVVFVGCGKEEPLYYSEIKEKEKIEDSTKDKAGKKEQDDNGKSGFLSMFGEGSARGDENCNMVNGGFVIKDGEDLMYTVPNNHFDRGSYVICRRKPSGESDEVLIEVEGKISELTIYGEYVFFRNNGLCRITKEGNNYTKLIDEDLSGLYIDNDWVYYGNKYRIKVDGTESEIVCESGEICSHTMNYDGKYAYFNETYKEDSYIKSMGIGKRKLDESEKDIINEISFVEYMTVKDDYIYYEDGKSLCRMKTDGSDVQTLLQAPCSVTSINVTDDNIFFCCGIDGYGKNRGIYRADKNGENVECLYKGNAVNIVIIDDWIYFKEKESGIYSCSINRIRTDGSQCEEFLGTYAAEHISNYVY